MIESRKIMTKVSEKKFPRYETGNILIYNDKDIKYYSGVPMELDVHSDYEEYQSLESDIKTIISLGSTLTVNITKFKELDNIMLDETTMKRIAKYNKEVEVKRLDNTIKEKKDKIKELDDILQDKEGKVKKLKEFVANLYNIDLDKDVDEDDEGYDWD